jgi:hypothetical protein
MGIWADIATWLPSPEVGPKLRAHRGLVVHIAEGSYGGTVSWLRNPAPPHVSAHFVAARDGRVAQLVDTSRQAWTQRAGNAEWLSVECEGRVPQSLTDPQLDAIARLLARCHALYGVPLAVTSDPHGAGLGHHAMGGPAWGHQRCPGPAIIAQKPDIVRRARALINPPPAPSPAPVPVSDWWTDLMAAFPVVSLGSSGRPVAKVQALANTFGHGLAVDGIAGPRTIAAVRAIQRRAGLMVDGVVGPKTLAVLLTG